MPGLLPDNRLKKTRLFRFLAKFYDRRMHRKSFRKLYGEIGRTSFDNALVFFFPHYSTGGAEKVHLDIVKAVSQSNTIVFFTSNNDNEHYLAEFRNYACCFDLFPWLKAEIRFSWKLQSLILRKINNSGNVRLFGSNSEFFYQLVKLVPEKLKCFDLIHAFTHENEPGAEKWSLPVVHKLARRIVINNQAKQDITDQYNKNNISGLEERICLIRNKTDIPDKIPPKNYNDTLSIIYAGRSGVEKRLHLVGNLASQCHGQLPVSFTLIGHNLEPSILPGDRAFCIFPGNISDFRTLKKYYEEAHIIILLSSREGFPMSIMEAMSYGVVPLVTDVGGIPEHIDGSNGFLINSRTREEIIIGEAYKKIAQLCANRELLERTSKNAGLYAVRNFNPETFDYNYRTLFDEGL